MKMLLCSTSALALALFPAAAAASPLSMTMDRTTPGGPYKVCANPLSSSSACATIGIMTPGGVFTPKIGGQDPAAIATSGDGNDLNPSSVLAVKLAPDAKDYVNVLSLLTPAQVADVVSFTGSLDLTATLQARLAGAGSKTVLWPGGRYQIAGTLTPPPNQEEHGVATGWNRGTIIQIPKGATGATFRFTNPYAVSGMAFNGDPSNPTTQYCIYNNNTNVGKVFDNFFANCGVGVYIDGASFYTEIMRNYFYDGMVYDIWGNSTAAQGFDLNLHLNHFLAANAARTQGLVRLDGLGSLNSSHNIATTASAAGPLFYANTPAPNYGGLQMTADVWEAASGNQPAVFFAGSPSAPWSLVTISNTIMTGQSGAALLLGSTSKMNIYGGELSSLTQTGVLRMSAYGVNTDLAMYGTDLEGNSGYAPIQADGNNGASVSLFGVKWSGVAPMVDLSKMGTGTLAYFDSYGGTVGTAANPFLLPAGTASIITGKGAVKTSAPISVASGGTGDTGTGWTPYTPAVACTSGALASSGNTFVGRYKTVGKTAFVDMTLSIGATGNGTCAGQFVVGLPAIAASYTVLPGRERAISGSAVIATVPASGAQAIVQTYSNGYPGGNGAVIDIGGSFETQ